MTRTLPTLLLLSLASSALAAPVNYIEDLSACQLPNALVTLPAPGTEAATKGDAFKLANASLTPLPYTDEGKVLAPADLLNQIRAAKSADLQYSPANDGTLWVFSGRVSDLGFRTLADAATLKPDRPMVIPATSRGAEGTLAPVREGHTYLIQTTDDRFALLRALEKTKDGLVVQYVYQGTGALQFDVPRAPLINYQRPQATTTHADARPAAATAPAFTTSIPVGPRDRVGPDIIVLRGNTPASTSPAADPLASDTTLQQLLRQRDLLIQRRLSILSMPARTPVDIDRKVQAINDLASLRADEAADLLVANITFYNPRPAGGAFSQEALHPAYAALKKLGKSASSASLKALRTLDASAQGEGLDAPLYKATLLANVLRAVEGDDVATFLLQKDAAAEQDPARKSIYESLLTPR